MATAAKLDDVARRVRIRSMYMFMSYMLASGETRSDEVVNNFGMAGGTGLATERPYDKRGREYLADHGFCRFDWHNLDVEPNTYVVWSANTEFWEHMSSVDLLPKRYFEWFVEGGLIYDIKKPSIWKPGENGPPDQSEIKVGRCSTPQDDGGAWNFHRVGPFYTNGNYDWWGVGWRDIHGLSNVIKKHPEGVYFSISFIIPFSDSGEMLGYPPIHIHHMHATAQPGAPAKMLKNTTSYVNNLVQEQHGDYICLPEDGGIDCLFESLGFDKVKEIDRVMDLDGVLNDVRAPGSTTMKWWFQQGIRWHPKSIGEYQPVSMNSIFGLEEPCMRNTTQDCWPKDANPQLWDNTPTETDPYGTLGKGPQAPEGVMGNCLTNAQNLAGTFDVNASDYTISWGVGHTFNAGELVRIKIHTHVMSTMFDRAFWFRASPQELGLVGGRHPFPLHNAYAYTLLSDTGLKTFDDLESYLIEKLRKAARRHDNDCQPASKPPSSCGFNRPFMVCKYITSHAEVYNGELKQSFLYDRAERGYCNQWTFKMKEVWTNMALFKPISRPMGPWAPMIPYVVVEHLNWFLSFRLQSPQIDGTLPFRIYHSYYSWGHAAVPNGSFVQFIAGDIWEYMLRLGTLVADLFPDFKFPVSYIIAVYKAQRWLDGLYDGPNDYPSLLEHGFVSQNIDLHQRKPSLSMFVEDTFSIPWVQSNKQSTIWQFGSALTALALMLFVCKSFKREHVSQFKSPGPAWIFDAQCCRILQFGGVQTNICHANDGLRASLLE